MNHVLDKLRALASAALTPEPTEADIVAACAIVSEALDAADAYVLRSGDPYFIRIGSESDPAQYGVKQRGYWLMWREVARQPHLIAVMADVEDRLVKAVRPLAAGAGGNHIAMVLPGAESNSDVLIVERGRSDAMEPDEECFLETARPILCQLIDKVLDTERRERQMRQLSAFADVARAFNNAHSMEAALTDLATAIARASGYDFVSIQIYDEALDNVVQHGMNVARHSNTETASLFRGEGYRSHFGGELYGPVPRRMRKGIPFLVPDVFAPGALPRSLQQYYERAHINSMAWLPMMFQDGVLGTVDFTSSIKRDFDDAEVAFLKALAAQAATAVKGMMLYRDLEESRREVLDYAAKLEEASQAEHFLARTDAVTGIPNRRYLEEVLKAEAARSSRYEEAISVVMCDVDHFKDINDTYGHPVGDEALRFVSRIARDCSRTSDFVGRWGGDEFLFILPQTKAEDAFRFAERFRHELRSVAFPAGAAGVSIPISAGVADAIPPPAADSTDLVSRADQALYSAKEGGRDQVCHWSPSLAA